MFAGFVTRSGEERLPKRVMFGEVVGGNGYSGGQEWDSMGYLEEGLEEFGIKLEGWREAARKNRQMVPTGRRRGGGFHAEMA